MNSHRLVRWLMIVSAALIAVSWVMSDHLPLPKSLGAAVLEEPGQLPTREKPFEARVEGVDYRIAPRFTYDITALVVSTHDSDAWWDYAHREWNDHVNVADLCVVWGDNVRHDAYRRGSYTHTQWECWVRFPLDPEHPFSGAALSNNHVVTDNPALGRRLKDVHIGDEVRVKGMLIDYATFLDGRQTGLRKTSIVRTDEGDGACEVIWVQDLEIIKSHNRPWRIAGKAAALLLGLALIAWILLPPRLDD
ncbi:MAG TPA: hypothetical protein VGN52_08680 [Burkholderiales bacterium]